MIGARDNGDGGVSVEGNASGSISGNVSSNGNVVEKLKLLSSQGGQSIDWLMGHDFGEIKIGAKQGVAPEVHLLAKLHHDSGSYGKGRGGNSGGSSGRRAGRDFGYALALRALDTRKKDAFVKLIPNGGTSSGKSMKAQMDYLSREGEEEIIRSEQFLGLALKDEEDREELIEAWGLNLPNKNNTDRTSHFVVSFPTGTDRDAADRAARAWASALFDSGNYGDVYDYYTVTHQDTDHPHTHVVVNRRGLHNGQWLKVSKRSIINYHELRHVQVEVAANEGIELKAVPRAAMGKTERPLTSAEVRRAGREGRDPIPRSYNEAGALEAAAKVFYYTNQMRFEGEALKERYPDIAKAITRLTQGLREGHSLRSLQDQENGRGNQDQHRHDQYKHGQDRKQQHIHLINDGKVKLMEEALEAIRERVIKEFQVLDLRVQRLSEDSLERSEIERQIADNKLRVAPFINTGNYDDVDAAIDKQGRYRGVYTDDQVGAAIKAEADAAVHAIAKQHGLDPDITLARYNSPKPATSKLADRWHAQEERALTAVGGNPSSVIDAHTEIAQVYGRARERLLDHRNLKQEILEDASRTTQEEHNQTRLAPRELRMERSLKRVARISAAISQEQREQLEQGDLSQLAGITKNAATQKIIARQYLEAAIELNGGRYKEALERTQRDLDRRAHPTGQENQQDQDQALEKQRQSPRSRSRSRNTDGFDL